MVKILKAQKNFQSLYKIREKNVIPVYIQTREN